jgi:hypothetical protein
VVLLVKEKFIFQNLLKITFVIWHGTGCKKNFSEMFAGKIMPMVK